MLYEVPSETDFPHRSSEAFLPTSFSDISNYIDEKIRIMKIFKSEMGTHPFPRSEKNIRALATIRGAAAGFLFAESFMLYKELW